VLTLLLITCKQEALRSFPNEFFSYFSSTLFTRDFAACLMRLATRPKRYNLANNLRGQRCRIRKILIKYRKVPMPPSRLDRVRHPRAMQPVTASRLAAIKSRYTNFSLKQPSINADDMRGVDPSNPTPRILKSFAVLTTVTPGFAVRRLTSATLTTDDRLVHTHAYVT
jgi:hypothetical protein